MKKIMICLLIAIFCGCSAKVKEYANIQEKFAEMTSYKADVSLTYISNKGNTEYGAKICAKSDGKYRIDITSPEEYSGNVLMYDGKLVWHYNPNLKDNKISANPPDKASRREIILFSFIKNYNKSMNTSVTTANTQGNKTTVLDAELAGDGSILASEKLYIDNEKLTPIKMIIYDNEKKERIVVKYNNFEYNEKLEDNLFKIS